MEQDAAVAVAACLNVTEPTSTGIGGDLFCLFYSASEKRIRGINASGRSPAALTLEKARSDLGLSDNDKTTTRIPMDHVHSVSVPGAAAGWCDVTEKFGSGKFMVGQLLEEAIRLAEDGYPVSQLAAGFWSKGEAQLRAASPNYPEMLKNGKRAPRNGEIMRMPQLAQTFREVAEKGKAGFYEGRVAEAIIAVMKERGGVMELEDLKDHMERGSQEVDPIGLEFGGHKVWECAPNGQGIVALIALGIIEALQERGVVGKLGVDEGWEHNSAK
jgi:gamma-glutamyltranspeptidase/glutathione hydrolase